MLGVGKWKFTVDTFLYKGDLFLNIIDNNGKYDFRPEVPGYNAKISYQIKDVKVDGNVIHACASTSMIPGNKEVSADFKFDGDTCIAIAEVPFLGKLELKNGVRV